jgi:hypothetical protein
MRNPRSAQPFLAALAGMIAVLLTTTIPSSRSVPSWRVAPFRSAAHAAAGPLLRNPVTNIPAIPAYSAACQSNPMGSACESAGIAALNNARTLMGQPAYALPSNFTTLSALDQLLALSNADRSLYGVSAVVGFNATLNIAAQAGVSQDTDPVGPSTVDGVSFRGWTSNWAAGWASPLYTYYEWMYDDGPAGTNIGCTATDLSGCWGHRDNTLTDFGANVVVMGAATGTSPHYRATAFTELYEAFPPGSAITLAAAGSAIANGSITTSPRPQPVWSSYQTLAAPVTGAPTASSWAPGRLDVFWISSSGTLTQMYYSATTWNGPLAFPGHWAGQPAAVSWGPNRVDVFTQGTSGTLQHIWWDGTAWSGPQTLATGVASAPTVTTWGPGRLDVFYLDTTGHLSQTYYADTTWRTNTNLGGTWTSSPAAVAWAPGRIDIVGAGPAGTLQHLWYANTWYRPQTLQPAASLTTAPTIASWASGRLDIFWINGGTLHHLWYTSTAWAGPQTLGGSLTATPAAVSWSANRIDVFADGSTQTLQHLWYTGP